MIGAHLGQELLASGAYALVLWLTTWQAAGPEDWKHIGTRDGFLLPYVQVGHHDRTAMLAMKGRGQ